MHCHSKYRSIYKSIFDRRRTRIVLLFGKSWNSPVHLDYLMRVSGSRLKDSYKCFRVCDHCFIKEPYRGRWGLWISWNVPARTPSLKSLSSTHLWLRRYSICRTSDRLFLEPSRNCWSVIFRDVGDWKQTNQE